MEARETIDIDFQKIWCVIKRRWLPAVGVFISSVAVFVVLASLQKAGYEAAGKILVKKINQTSALTGLGEQVGQLEGLDIKSSPISTEIEVMRSIPLLEKTIAILNLKDKKGVPITAENFSKIIGFKAIPSTDVIQLSYSSKDSQEAVAVVNILMKLYVENNVLSNRAAATAASEFIAKELSRIKANVHNSDVALRNFKEKNKLVSLDEESRSLVTNIQGLESKITETQAALAEAKTRSINLQQRVGMNSQKATDIDSLNRSTGVQKILEEYQQVESLLAVQQTRFLDSHPSIENLKKKRDALRFVLQQRVSKVIGNREIVTAENLQTGQITQQLTASLVQSEVERLALSSRLEQLSQTVTIYKQRISNLPQLEQQQRELERQAVVSQSTYETLLKKLQEVRITENQNVGNARIIETASVSKKSVTVQKISLIFLGSFLGIFLATMTIVILEIRDTSIKRLKEVKELFGYTLLGVIPSLSKKAISRRKDMEWTIPELPVRDAPRLPIAQAYQILQANLKFTSSDNPLRAIAITSSVPKEGKSTVSANLAAVMAQLGRKVLLVDADMHHSLQHHIWNFTNTAGLSDVIVGEAEFNTTVKEVMPNLHILTAGVIPPNPLALLDSKRMAALIEHFSTIYDFVIIDTPPLALGADALTLGRIMDGVLLVVRPGVVTFASATAAKESLERSGQNVLGLVVNGVIVENEPDSYFYYAKEYSEQKYSRQKVTKPMNY
ncbi:MAG: polysaccharide biosynthesis tyrosine autokinase [Cyanomargarita calcarea GSE-NOS-MK-12-04C]|jgi:capsular exopolysaccharide synthesis family protein|uniref:non-specific protein-tyrosine kinase n=1 Tax=Cyanomargarita calcarea GSE-NOS-MK-12-04C TaxID=2839659 RepID=A0A951QR48_9CYAN|nr:polysaccharide biosynthesis tyrosine autokinase [Cyanomargarita calcarea GSE-NOS-MK-12-04C]